MFLIHIYFIVRFGDGVKHFQIQQLIDGRYFVVQRKTFSTLHELIQYYVKTALMKPYVQVFILNISTIGRYMNFYV